MLLQLNTIKDLEQRGKFINSLIFDFGVPVLSIFGGGWILSGSAFVASRWAPKAAEFIAKNAMTIRHAGSYFIATISSFFRNRNK